MVRKAGDEFGRHAEQRTITDYHFSDGLGRELETVRLGQEQTSPSYHITQRQAYDVQGRWHQVFEPKGVLSFNNKIPSLFEVCNLELHAGVAIRTPEIIWISSLPLSMIVPCPSQTIGMHRDKNIDT